VIAVRVILVTVAGPAGHVDIGVRSDVTPAELADSLSAVLGIGGSAPVAEHRSPPRPGDLRGRRAPLPPRLPLAQAGVADGDLVVFRVPAQEPPHGTAGPSAIGAPDLPADEAGPRSIPWEGARAT
jgi:type VII secretion system (Wss) protein YukD